MLCTVNTRRSNILSKGCTIGIPFYIGRSTYNRYEHTDIIGKQTCGRAQDGRNWLTQPTIPNIIDSNIHDYIISKIKINFFIIPNKLKL